MRIVLKPVGVMFILGGFLLLLYAAVWRNRTPAEPPARSTTASPVAGTVSPKNTAVPDAPAATPTPKAPLPPGVLLMPDIASNEWLQMITPPSVGEKSVESNITVVDASVPGHPRARHIDVLAVNNKPWYIQIARPLSVPLKKGDRIRLTFWARSKNSCPVSAVVEQNAAPYTKVIFQTETLTPEWKQYTQEWTQVTSTPENWAKMDFHLGHKVGEIELTGVIIRKVTKK